MPSPAFPPRLGSAAGFVGLQMAWMALFVRLISAAVQINLLNTYLAGFWVPAGTRIGGALTSAVLLGFLAWVNLRGVRGGTGTRTSSRS